MSFPVFSLALSFVILTFVELKPEMVSGFDNTKVGTQTLTITINGKIARLDEEIHDGDVIVIE